MPTARLIARAGSPLRYVGDITVRAAGRRAGARGHAPAWTRNTGHRVEAHDRGLPIRLADGGLAHAYLVPFRAQEEDGGGPDDPRAAAFLGSLDRGALLVTTLAAMLAIAATWMISRRIVGPIAELSAAAGDLSAGKLDRRVNVAARVKWRISGRRFNAMAAELERQHTLRRGLLHDVAHELRTPLTALRCRLETWMDGLSPGARHRVSRHARRGAAPRTTRRRPPGTRARGSPRAAPARGARRHRVPLIASAIRAAGLEHDPRIHVNADPGLIAHADAVRVRQIVLNLLANADRHTPAGGTINIRRSHARSRRPNG